MIYVERLKNYHELLDEDCLEEFKSVMLSKNLIEVLDKITPAQMFEESSSDNVAVASDDVLDDNQEYRKIKRNTRAPDRLINSMMIFWTRGQAAGIFRITHIQAASF